MELTPCTALNNGNSAERANGIYRGEPEGLHKAAILISALTAV